MRLELGSDNKQFYAKTFDNAKKNKQNTSKRVQKAKSKKSKPRANNLTL